MCGLAGVALFGEQRVQPVYEAILRAMAQDLAHREPDEERLLRDGPLGLAFRRLAIVDVAGGHQPFVSEDGK